MTRRAAILVLTSLAACAAPSTRLTPEHGGALHGAVLSADHKPIPGALVSLECDCLQRGREATTGPDGMYRFTDLPAGEYGLRARSGDLKHARKISLMPGSKLRVDLVLIPPSPFRLSRRDGSDVL